MVAAQGAIRKSCGTGANFAPEGHPDSVMSMSSPSRLWIPAAIADLLLVLVFAAIGRDAHARGDIISGAFATAWPFLAGAAIAWAVTRAWRSPLGMWPSGVCIWIGAVVVGMLLRAATGQVVVLPFVLVALITLGVFLLGYRLLAAMLLRASRKRQRRV
jgi:peptidoglycan/LPS O-acetylase OafA/YrhL